MPYRPFRAVVDDVARLSPSFIRVTFGGAELAGFGPAGLAFDQRIKLIFPTSAGELPDLPADGNWYEHWRTLPEHDRGVMRTYSIRDVERDARGTRLSVDFVLHLGTDGADSSGPAATWAHGARSGDELVVIGPDRDEDSGSGIEFSPGATREFRLFGDETAAPAIARILGDLPAGSVGEAAIEVPTAEDVLPLTAPAGVRVRWLPRDGAAHGSLLATAAGVVTQTPAEPDDAPLLWETPLYSSSGERLDAAPGRDGDVYYWIAGESGMVTGMRRGLVKTHGIPRSRVSFMGYWKRGVAMRG
ncbi:siderophore-interacting protein [Corynebacterium halotolerans]|uniref:FAD-binding FR-type domain-containing protein n=1 Tax=Corynebacterium halotolerans YIM 70093 = DSM 44683 TaxID=1121362 RepID=M1NVW9_9CORY|nr:siderophore-interacting protein [Corynebacterium halotolerans]AGF71640.1 hypothetical protein A605_03135 [Corynebacterium halotolerans YIM 70093 = DSM 44683]